MHAILIFVCGFREVDEANTEGLGKLLRFLEVICCFAFIAILVEAFKHNFAWSGWNFRRLSGIAKYLRKSDDFVLEIEAMDIAFPEMHLSGYKNIHPWAGKVIEWLALEIFIFTSYLCTLLILIVKSRFTLVGIDSSHQFEPIYMSKMANMIVDEM